MPKANRRFSVAAGCSGIILIAGLLAAALDAAEQPADDADSRSVEMRPALPRIYAAPRPGEPKWAWVVRPGLGLFACRYEATNTSQPAVCGPAWTPGDGPFIETVHPVTRQVTWLWSWVLMDDGSLRVCRAPGVQGNKAKPACGAVITMSDGAQVAHVHPVDKVGARQWAWIVDDAQALYVCRFNSTAATVERPVCSSTLLGRTSRPVLNVHPIVHNSGRQTAWVQYADATLGACSFETGDKMPASLACAPLQ